MRRILRTGLILLLLFVLQPPTFVNAQVTGESASGDAPQFEKVDLEADTTLPPLELRVIEVEGSPYVNYGDTRGWIRIKQGDKLDKKSRLVTLEDERVKMEIPGVSYIEVDTATEIVVGELLRSKGWEIDRSGLLTDVKPTTRNEVELEAVEGEVSNSLRDHEDMETNYQIKTPVAVAGVRGTSFSCRVHEGTSSCSVLEGEVNFSSLGDSRLSTVLGSGLSSKFEQGRDTVPPSTQNIQEKTREKLQEVKDQAEEELLLEPHLGDFWLEGHSFEKVSSTEFRTNLDYYRPRRIRLSGQAWAREKGTKLQSVNVKRGDESLSVSGLRKWKTGLKPDTVSPGRQRTLELTVLARDDTGTRSYPHQLNVKLTHPAGEDVLPSAYDPGDVSLELEEIGRITAENIEFPYHLYRDDREIGQAAVRLSGRAEAGASIEGVAYSLNDGITWEPADGTDRWRITLPLKLDESRRLQPEMLAWTEDETISSPEEIGRIVYNNRTVDQEVRRLFRRMWEAFSKNNQTAFERLLNQESFVFKTEDGENRMAYGQWSSFLATFHDELSDVEIFYQVKATEAGEAGGTIRADVELQGYHEPTGAQFKLLAPSTQLRFSRRNNGTFKLTELTGLQDRMYLYTREPFVIESGEWVDLRTLQTTSSEKGDVRIEQDYAFGDTTWVLRTGDSIQKGGIFKLRTNNLSEVFPIPERGSGLYQSADELEMDRYYAINILRADGTSLYGILKANSTENDTLEIDMLGTRTTPGLR